MVITLVLAVLERTRELGMLRAIGMSRRRVRRMVRHVASLAVFVVAAIVAGLVAAVAPARRASRLDVLHALRYE